MGTFDLEVSTLPSQRPMKFYIIELIVEFRVSLIMVSVIPERFRCNVRFLCYLLAFIFLRNLLSMEPWAAAKKKKLSVSVVVPPAPVRVPSQRPLAASVASTTSLANDKGDNDDPGGCAQISWHLLYS